LSCLAGVPLEPNNGLGPFGPNKFPGACKIKLFTAVNNS
jgi:hypothetical protein